MTRITLILFALACAPGCDGDAVTEIVLVVDTDLAVPTDFDTLRVEVTGTGPAEIIEEAWSADDRPATLGLTGSGDVEILVAATGPAGSLARTVRTTFVDGSSKLLHVVLTRACLEVDCGEQTCAGDGDCISAALSTLPDFTGVPPARNPIDGSMPDGSGLDGALDAGPDAGTDAGPDCTDPSIPCACTSDAECEPDETCLLRRCLSVPLRDVSIGDRFVCALTEGRELFCGGRNSDGQLGIAMTAAPQPPALVPEFPAELNQIESGAGHTCGIGGPQDSVFCWGRNAEGQASGADDVAKPRLVVVPGLPSGPAVALSAGRQHTCAAFQGAEGGDGHVFCWGSNATQQLGISDLAEQGPIEVPRIANARELALGDGFSCAIDADERIWCWGERSDGQTGSGFMPMPGNPGIVAPPAGRTGPHSLVAGRNHACVLFETNFAYCWGVGADQVGTFGNPRQPLADAGAARRERFVALDAGNAHTCGLTADGQVVCWGSDVGGQLLNEPASVGAEQLWVDGAVSCYRGAPAGRLTLTCSGALE